MYHSYKSNGEIKQRKAVQFSVSYRDGRWLIRTVQIHGDLPYVETGFDGESYKTYVPVPAPPGRPVVGPYGGTGILDTGDVPHVFADPTTSVLWLGYCAWDYIPEATNALLEPLFVTDHMSGDMNEIWRFGIKYKAQIDRTHEKINSIVYWHPGKIYGWTREKESWISGPVKLTLMPPYNIGYTSAVYRAQTSQRVGALEVPQISSYTVYYPTPKGVTNAQLYTIEDYVLTATNISSQCKAMDFKPKISGPVMAVERRFDSDPVPAHQFNYIFQNQWLSKNEVAKLREYSNQLSMQQFLKPVVAADVQGAKKKQSKWMRALVYLLFAGFAFAGITHFLKINRKPTLQFRSSSE